MSKEFVGTGVALVTPFNKKLAVDYAALEKVIEHTIRGKVSYLVSLGTTGETATLSKEEKKKVLHTTIEIVKNRVPVVVGYGGNNTTEIIENIKEAPLSKIAAILSVSPYYNKPTQNGIFHHYKAISQSTKHPIILYNVPGRTASNISAATTLQLAKNCKNIIGIKEASGDLNQCMELVLHRPKNFLLISGDDALTFPLIGLGFDGVISVVGNALPHQFSEMVRLALAGENKAALKLHYQLLNIINLLFVEGNPAGVKAALKLLKVVNSEAVRLPLVAASVELLKKLNTALAAAKI